jgi:hypothetical protein
MFKQLPKRRFLCPLKDYTASIPGMVAEDERGQAGVRNSATLQVCSVKRSG